MLLSTASYYIIIIIIIMVIIIRSNESFWSSYSIFTIILNILHVCLKLLSTVSLWGHCPFENPSDVISDVTTTTLSFLSGGCNTWRSASFRGASEGQLCQYAVWSLSQSEAPPDVSSSVPVWSSSRCFFFSCFWTMHRYDPSWPHMSQDSLCALKRRKKDRKWRHRVT